jgi:hypothetical protein
VTPLRIDGNSSGGISTMAQRVKTPIPGIAAAGVAAFGTVITTPELHSFGASARRCHQDGAVVRLPWRRPVAVVMRGWHPRAAKPRRSLSKRIAAAVAAFFHRRADD